MGNAASQLENDVKKGFKTLEEAIKEGESHIGGAAKVPEQCAEWLKRGHMTQGELVLCCRAGCPQADGWRPPTGNGCGHPNTQYTGGIIKQYPPNGYKGHPRTIQACQCQAMCAGHPGCVGWQITSNQRICQLKGGGGRISPLGGWQAGMIGHERQRRISVQTVKKFCSANANSSCKTLEADIAKQQKQRGITCVDSLGAYISVAGDPSKIADTMSKLRARQAKSDATIAELHKHIGAQQHSLDSIRAQRKWAQTVVSKAKILSPLSKFVAATPDDQIAMINTAIEGFYHFGFDVSRSVTSALKMSPAQSKKTSDNCKAMIGNLETLRDSVYWWREMMPVRPNIVQEAANSLVNKGIPTFIDPIAKSIDQGYAAQEHNTTQRIATLNASVEQATVAKARAQTNIDNLNKHLASVSQASDKMLARAKEYCWDSVESQGCWKDQPSRAMQQVVHDQVYPQECYRKVKDAGYAYAGFQDYQASTGKVGCFGAHDPKEFQKYGPAPGACGGGGAPWVNSVYKI